MLAKRASLKQLAILGNTTQRLIYANVSTQQDMQRVIAANAALKELNKKLRGFDRTPYYVNDYHEIKEAVASDGSVGPMPKWYRLGLLKVTATIVFFVSFGAFIGKMAVNFLEDNNIFKPEGDDDDDDDD